MTLRRFTALDLDDLVELHNDGDVMRFLNDGRPVAASEVADELSSWIEGAGEVGGRPGFWAAIEARSGVFLGWFHLRPRPGDGELQTELGFRLRRSAWGNGLATEGSLALVLSGFDELPIERVYAHTMSVHRASRRVMEKIGLRLVRTFPTEWPIRIPGDEHGDVEYAVTRPEWEGSRSASHPVT